tara:strand:- start:6277 stop:6861 length:585 start_codon:yes stop_codon:yes gene_type:complete
MNENEQKRALDTWTKTMLTNAHKFDGLLDPTTKIVTHKKPVKKLDREEAKWEREHFTLIQREDGIVHNARGYNHEKFSDDLPFDEYKRFLEWASHEITHFESVGIERGIEAMLDFLKMVGLYDILMEAGFEKDKVYRQIGWAMTLIPRDTQSRSYVARQREHFSYYRANLNTLLEELKDTNGEPYYLGYIEEEE